MCRNVDRRLDGVRVLRVDADGIRILDSDGLNVHDWRWPEIQSVSTAELTPRGKMATHLGLVLDITDEQTRRYLLPSRSGFKFPAALLDRALDEIRGHQTAAHDSE